MSDGRFARTELLLGPEGMERLRRARVAVFGLGGVGGWCAEALARSGVGAMEIVDDDDVALTNINRQVMALSSTVGQRKTQVIARRLLDINPELELTVSSTFFTAETADSFDFSAYDYVVDAVDTVSAKLELAVRCDAAGTPLIAAMGAGNKLDPTAFRVADIYETSVCPLARIMRKELRRRGVKGLKVVYSQEEPRQLFEGELPRDGAKHGHRSPTGSIAFVPPVMGLIMAGQVVKDLAGVR